MSFNHKDFPISSYKKDVSRHLDMAQPTKKKKKRKMYIVLLFIKYHKKITE